MRSEFASRELKRDKTDTRELDPAAETGSLIGSVEPVARRALAEVRFAPLVVVGGGDGIVGAEYWIFAVDK